MVKTQGVERHSDAVSARKDPMNILRRVLVLLLEAGAHASARVSHHYYDREDFEESVMWQIRAEWFERMANKSR